jgi:hypothetical protein
MTPYVVYLQIFSSCNLKTKESKKKRKDGGADYIIEYKFSPLTGALNMAQCLKGLKE